MYVGQFRDINEVLYTINIIPQNDDGSITELVLSAEPLVITQDKSGLFEPIKPLQATIEILTPSIYPDLYSNDNKSTEVLIYRNGSSRKLIFEGFLTPRIYNQTYTSSLDTLQLEAVSKMTVLEDTDYKTLSTSGNPAILTFQELVKHLFLNGAKYNTDTFKVYYCTAYDRALSDYSISESNFFDDDDTRTPWKMSEVLGQICKYLNLTCFEFEGIIYLVDYMYIIKMDPLASLNFKVITYETPQVDNIDLVKNLLQILPTDYQSNDGNISYDDIYNKVTVNANCYNLDEITTDIEDLQNSKPLSSYPTSAQWYKRTYKSNGKLKNEERTYNTYNTLRLIKEDTDWKHRYWRIKAKETQLQVDKVISAVELDASVDKPWYDPSSVTMYNTDRSDIINTRCAVINRYALYNSNEPTPTKLNWENCIMFNCLDDTINASTAVNENAYFDVFTYRSATECPVLEYTLKEPIRYSPNTGKSWITIKGSLLYQRNTLQSDTRYHVVSTSNKTIEYMPLNDVLDVDPYAMSIYDSDKYSNEGFVTSTKSKHVSKYFPNRGKNDADYGKGYPMQKFKLRIGNKWWSGLAWSDVEQSFYVNFGNNPKNGETETFNCFEWQEVSPNFDFQDGLEVDSNVWAIPIRPSDNVSGLLQLTVYTPSQMNPLFTSSRSMIWKTMFPVIYMKGFEVNYVYSDNHVWFMKEDTKKEDEDIVYSNTVDTDFVNEYEDIEMKINTYTNNVPVSRSFVMCDNTNSYVTKHYNKATDTTREMEYHIIEKILDHYITKKLIYEATITAYNDSNSFVFKPHLKHEVTSTTVDTFKNDDGSSKLFIVDTYEFDVKQNTAKVKFIEW